jgi:hypothetical protein
MLLTRQLAGGEGGWREPCAVYGRNVWYGGKLLQEGQGDGNSGDDDEAESELVQRFTQAFNTFESMRASIYAHDITKRDQETIVNIERLLFSLKRKGATKQMINDFIKKR